jgi:hypothetical protein
MRTRLQKQSVSGKAHKKEGKVFHLLEIAFTAPFYQDELRESWLAFHDAKATARTAPDRPTVLTRVMPDTSEVVRDV